MPASSSVPTSTSETASTGQTPISNRGLPVQFLPSCPYFRPLVLRDVTASIDNVRIKFVYPNSVYNFDANVRIDTIQRLLERIAGMQFWSEHFLDWNVLEHTFRCGAYAYTVNYWSTESYSFAVMLGRYDYRAGARKFVAEAVLDFNPNKVPEQKWQRIFGMLAGDATRITVQRFDLALDFFVERDTLHLVQRPGSEYRKMVDEHGAITEYIGKRSNHAAVKLYDKAAELLADGFQLPTPLTRLEITVEPARFKGVQKLFPTIQSCGPLELSLCLDELPFQVQAVIIHPDLYDRLKASTSRHTWQKYSAFIQSYTGTILTVPEDQLTQIDRYLSDYLVYLTSSTLL